MSAVSEPGNVGRTRDAQWQIGVSRTVDVPLERVWALLASPEGTALWLSEGTTISPEPGTPIRATDGSAGETRSYRPLDRIRLTWRPPDRGHESTVQVALHRVGPGRTSIRFHQERLADTHEREVQRAHWQGVMDAAVARLTGNDASA